MNNMFSRCCSFETLRNMLEFKHVRLKSTNDSCKDKSKLPTEIVKKQSEILCNILNCNVHTALEIITKNNVNEFNHNFYLNAKFCKNYLKLSDIIEFPSLLIMQPSLLQHRYFSLKELGFCNVTPNCIFRFSYILKKTPQEMKEKGFCLSSEYKSNILTEYLNASERAEIIKKLQQMYSSGSNFQKIKEAMNAEYLSAKLECSIGTAHLMLHKNTALQVQSILNTDQLLNMLLYKFGFSISKIRNSLYLLSVHHENVEHFVSEIPEILGVNILHLVKRLPQLLKQEHDSIKTVEGILKDFNISKDQLYCCPKILLFTPRTLKKRLTTLCSTEEFAVLKSSKKFLWLVYYYSNLNSRLKSLKDENIPFSINMFTATKSTFEKYLVFSNTRRGIKDTCLHLAKIFKVSEKEIYDRLQNCSYIQNVEQNCSILNCQKVIEFLLISGVTKNQILNGIEIVCFDIEIVKENFYKMKNHPLCQPYEEWFINPNFVQLLIYIIEKVSSNTYMAENFEHDESDLEMFSHHSF